MNTEKKATRISSIDMLRGLVMLIMLVDHVRERFFLHMQVTDPMDVTETDSGLFFTRLSAHLCAPVFVFLTGLSSWLYANPINKAPRSPRSFLLKRGLFLVLLEITLVNLSWFGTYNTLYLQVIWVIGLSMICLGILCTLPRVWIGVIGFLIVFGHNALSPISFTPNETGYSIWTILHDRGYLLQHSFLNIKISYPLLPWIGVILLGYFAGPLYQQQMPAIKRQKALIAIGCACLVLLAILRGFNIYGETLPWHVHESNIMSIMSFFNYTKYPPSLDFILLTLGIGHLLLFAFEKYRFRWMQVLKTFGSAPMFFYIVHLYILLAIYSICVAIFGTNHGDYFGVSHLLQIWLIAILLSVLLYYPTKVFSAYKRKSSSKLITYF